MSNPLIVFTYAPAGLGHIRVADALMSGIPAGLDYVVFAPSDKTTETTHRFTSLNVPARHVMEFFQRGAPEALFTKLYTGYLKTHTGNMAKQFLKLIREQKKIPDKIVIIATHFGLAYQLGAIKNRLEKELGTTIKLVVQVTDDSPQVIWYVDSTDLIVCPSHKTKTALLAFAAKNDLIKVPVEVAPYPVNVDLARTLALEKISERKDQYDSTKATPINVIIPVSGAAVGMEFFLHLITRLHKLAPRFFFHVVCRKAPFTQNFISRMGHREYVKLYISNSYKAIVEMYRQIYLENVISAEITKPSEQSFKALLSSQAVGGSYLLFAEPVGRQEHDNINFLQRHRLLSGFTGNFAKSNTWRGFILPYGSKVSADLIWDLYASNKLYNAFSNYSSMQSNGETGDDGVSRFWKLILAYQKPMLY